MPRKSTKRQQAVECRAHGQRCALYAGRGYRSERCAPAEPRPRQLAALLEMMGVDPDKDRQQDTRPLAVQDAEFRRLVEQAEAHNADRLAAVVGGELS